jgi:hypothetical protein
MASLLSQRGGFGSPAIFPGWPFIVSGDREKYAPAKGWCDRLARAGGANLFGEPMFRPVWGWCETRIGTIPRYPHALSQWLILRWVAPAISHFGTRTEWYEPRYEGGERIPSPADEFREEWPSRGAYEIHFAFPAGAPFNLKFAEELVRKYVNRPKLLSLSQRYRDDRTAIEAEKDRAMLEDWERFNDATPAFAGEPMIGYGQKSADEPAPQNDPIPPSVFRRIQKMTATRAARLERQQGAV